MGLFKFNEDGNVISFEAKRYYGRKGGAALEDWFILIEPNSYKEFEGVKIPSYASLRLNARLCLGLLLAMGSVYIGLKLLDKLTKGIDEMEELKKGNIAVRILIAAVIFSIAVVVQSGVAGLSAAVQGKSGATLILAAGIGVLQLLIGIVIAVVAIYIAINVLDRITVEIDEMEELKKRQYCSCNINGWRIASGFICSSGRRFKHSKSNRHHLIHFQYFIP